MRRKTHAAELPDERGNMYTKTYFGEINTATRLHLLSELRSRKEMQRVLSPQQIMYAGSNRCQKDRRKNGRLQLERMLSRISQGARQVQVSLPFMSSKLIHFSHFLSVVKKYNIF